MFAILYDLFSIFRANLNSFLILTIQETDLHLSKVSSDI